MGVDGKETNPTLEFFCISESERITRNSVTDDTGL